MAQPTLALIRALRKAAARLASGSTYQWGHMGSCNCGHLAQELTSLDKATIHQSALERAGDWGQQAIDYCPDSGFPLDHILTTMFDAGLDRHDINELERLSNPEVLARLPGRDLKRNNRADAVDYMQAMADLLEERWLAQGGREVRLFEIPASTPEAA